MKALQNWLMKVRIAREFNRTADFYRQRRYDGYRAYEDAVKELRANNFRPADVIVKGELAALKQAISNTPKSAFVVAFVRQTLTRYEEYHEYLTSRIAETKQSD